LQACLILRINLIEMTDSSLSPEEFSKQVLKNLMGTKSGINRFNDLLQLASLEKDLLQISSYESAKFILNKKTD